ncbi:PIN domain-containing protein [Brevundimonas sp. AJA228-03]|uniref:PIN domain-containing protein n=1 Tax=Brevundimonas sp. AJA228-03 TaxID=2752515 RepID=UPI001FD79532|nr:PIN domain-containing protein [Brevundimonas sp. AJA228-03]
MTRFLLDTNVAIGLRDDVMEVQDRVLSLQGEVALSVLTRVELEGGSHRDPADADRKRARLDTLLQSLPVFPFDDDAADAYRAIVQSAGFSRRKIIDRMIAAQAMSRDLTLVTLNGADFRDIPGLDMVEW